MPQNGLVIISIRLYNRVAFEGEGLNTLFLNRDFYGQYNILTYIESSMRLILVNNQTILATKEYWLYYYIREDFVANFYALYNTDIDLDCFGFTVVQRNTRHAIEAYLDLVNLVADSEYLTVLEYCANKGRYNDKYHSYIHGKLCGVPVKYKIATQMYNQSFPVSLKQIAADNNNYIHPNVFVDIISASDYNRKASILRNLLNTNLFVFTEAYKLMLQKFANGIFPVLGCNGCNAYPPNCNACFENEKAKFQNLITNVLFTYNTPMQAYYQQPPFLN